MTSKQVALVITGVVLVIGLVYHFATKSTPSVNEIDNQSSSTAGVGGPDTVESPNYVLWDKDAYSAARTAGKTVVLYFTANWCPTCREQEPINKQAFAELVDDPSVAIFRVHILDSETTKETEQLADDLGVRYQHTYIIFAPSGREEFRYTGEITQANLLAAIDSAKGGDN